MADRFPLIVNEVSKKIEELVSGDNLDLSGNGIVVNGDTGSGKYLKSDGSTVFWDIPGDVYLTQTQTISNKTFELCNIDGNENTLSNIPNVALSNSSITINGESISLGGTVTTPNDDTTYFLSAQDTGDDNAKAIRLTSSLGIETFAAIAVSIPASVPSGSNALDLILTRTNNEIKIRGTVVDNNTITTLQAATGGSAQSGDITISGSGGATVSQDSSTKTINIDTRNDDTITQLRGGTGQVFSDGNFTFLPGTAVGIAQGTDANSDPTITISSSDTVTQLKGGGSGTFVSGDVTITGGSGGNVTVSQSGNTINIDSTDTNTVTQIASGTETLASGNFVFKQAGATTISQQTLGNGDIEIEINSLNTDTGASFVAGSGLVLTTVTNGQEYSIKNAGNLIDNRIPIWDSANTQFANGSITDNGTQVTIDGDLIVKGTNTILETTTLTVQDDIIEVRRPPLDSSDALVGGNGGLQVNRTTNADTQSVITFSRLEWFESGAYWRVYDGSVALRLVTETETQTLTNKTIENPTLTTPVLGVATATTINGLQIDSTSGSLLDITDQKILRHESNITFQADDSNLAEGVETVTVNFDQGGGSGAKVAYDSYHLGLFALTTSQQLSGKIQDKSGSGKLMFDTNPTIIDSILTSSNAFDLINTSALGVNFAGAATSIAMGASTGTTTIGHNVEVGLDITVGSIDESSVVTGGDILLYGYLNSDQQDIQIRGTDSQPIYVGRGGGAVATNTRVGYNALGSNQSGSLNIAFGHSALLNNVAGAANTALGYRTLRDNDGGNNNIAIGKDALLINESGDGNIGIGVSSLANNPSSGYNVCIGHYAGHATTGIGNVIIGPADTEDILSTTYAAPAASGDRQLVIGAGTGAWIRGDSSFNVTLPNDLTVDGDARVIGDLRVDGSVVSINSSTLTIDDKNIELASVANLTITATVSNGSTFISDITPTSGVIVGMEISSSGGAIPNGTVITAFNPQAGTATLSNAVSSEVAEQSFNVLGPTDSAADGGGLIIKGTPVLQGGTGDKSILYDHSRTEKYFVSTESFELASSKRFSIGNQLVLDGTTLGSTVVNSSLTSVGVLSGPAGQPALETAGAVVFGGRVLEEVFSNMTTSFSLTSNTLSVTAAAANTICGETVTANQAINTWAFSTADPDGNTLANGQSLTVTLIIDASTASTYGDDCTVDGNTIATGVRWSGGSPPIATSNTDILTFLIVKDSTGNIRVYGQGNTDFS